VTRGGEAIVSQTARRGDGIVRGVALLVVLAVLVAGTAGVGAGAVDDERDRLLDRVESAVATYNEDPERYLGAVEGTLASETVAFVAFDQRVDVHVLDADPDADADADAPPAVFSVRTTASGRAEEFARAPRPDATVRVLVDRTALEGVLAGNGFSAADLAAAVVAGDVRVECVWRRVLADPSNARCLLLHVPSHPVQAAVGATAAGAAIGSLTVWRSRLLELLGRLRRLLARGVDGVVEEFARNPVLALPTVKGLWDAYRWLAAHLYRVITTPLRHLRRRDGSDDQSTTDRAPDSGPRTGSGSGSGPGSRPGSGARTDPDVDPGTRPDG
jgi:hypothetical protein